MTPLKTIDELAPTTIQNYRSKLRHLFLSQPSLAEHEAETVRRKIARLEAQLGVKADSIGRPGRPRLSQGARHGSPAITNSVFGTRGQTHDSPPRPISLLSFSPVLRQNPERVRGEAIRTGSVPWAWFKPGFEALFFGFLDLVRGRTRIAIQESPYHTPVKRRA
jgi:hypothetical protein